MTNKNLWPDNFLQDNSLTPKEIIKQQANFLTKLTKGVVFAELAEGSILDKRISIANKSFNFEFNIRGSFLSEYKFRAFSISHDIIYYPCYLWLDPDIYKEFNVGEPRLIKVDNEEALLSLLDTILNSKKIVLVVNSIYKLSK